MADEAVQEVSLDTLDMDEYKKARAEGKSTVEQPKKEEVVEPEPKEPVEEAEETPEEPKEKPKSKGGFQRRLDKLSKEKAMAEEKAAELEKRLQALESKQPAKPTADGEPKEEDFTKFEDYLKAQARWEVRQELKAQKEAEQKEIKSAKEAASYEAYEEKAEAAREKYEDFDELVEATKLPWPEKNPSQDDINAAVAFKMAVLEDDNSAEIAYHYAKHPDELLPLGEMTPVQVVRAISRLSDKLGTAKPEKAEEKHEKPKSKAPTPIRPVSGGSSKTSVPLDEVESMAEYKKRRAAGEKR